MSNASDETTVIFVRRREAKTIKSRLEQAFLLDKRFRMTPVHDGDVGTATTCPSRCPSGGDDAASTDQIKGCIAIPVSSDCVRKLRHYHSSSRDNISSTSDIERSRESSLENNNDEILGMAKSIVDWGRHVCPFSTSMLGNNNRRYRRRCAASKCIRRNKSMESSFRDKEDEEVMPSDHSSKSRNGENRPPLTRVQYALVETLCEWVGSNGIGNDEHEATPTPTRRTSETTIETLVRKLDARSCPKKLEVMGDDRTLVIPRWALFLSSGKFTMENAQYQISKRENRGFFNLLIAVICLKSKTNAPIDEVRPWEIDKSSSYKMHNIQSHLWKNLAKLYSSPRVIRRGDIDPESGFRESGNRILWPALPTDEAPSIDNGDCNRGFRPARTGPESPGWVTVTEHKISQSFDLTRVMFSRGNVTEKKRFGSLVQEGERVLDMYAGIGYYTLPALIHGKAKHVTACEWNPHALDALRCNLKANGVDDKVTVLDGNCCTSLQNLIAEKIQFDRISLGLLPSSEGGWRTAVSCACLSTGCWLHVHGNVPTAERTNWTHWLCHTLTRIAGECEHKNEKQKKTSSWVAICTHVEKVKSFAPMIDHVVADVFIGPRGSSKMPKTIGDICVTGVLDSQEEFVSTPMDISPPSCALNEEGILNQRWLRLGSKS